MQTEYINARIKIAERRQLLENFDNVCFNGYNGSNRKLVEVVKSGMNNPKSFEHVKTQYKVLGNFATIIMSFRGTNAFGAVVTNNVKAKVNVETCEVVKVY